MLLDLFMNMVLIAALCMGVIAFVTAEL